MLSTVETYSGEEFVKNIWFTVIFGGGCRYIRDVSAYGGVVMWASDDARESEGRGDSTSMVVLWSTTRSSSPMYGPELQRVLNQGRKVLRASPKSVGFKSGLTSAGRRRGWLSGECLCASRISFSFKGGERISVLSSLISRLKRDAGCPEP